jgi:hypothetical protein
MNGPRAVAIVLLALRNLRGPGGTMFRGVALGPLWTGHVAATMTRLHERRFPG